MTILRIYFAVFRRGGTKRGEMDSVSLGVFRTLCLLPSVSHGHQNLFAVLTYITISNYTDRSVRDKRVGGTSQLKRIVRELLTRKPRRRSNFVSRDSRPEVAGQLSRQKRNHGAPRNGRNRLRRGPARKHAICRKRGRELGVPHRCDGRPEGASSPRGGRFFLPVIRRRGRQNARVRDVRVARRAGWGWRLAYLTGGEVGARPSRKGCRETQARGRHEKGREEG